MCCRSGWLEFTHTASSYNITSTRDTLSHNFTGAVDNAFSTFESTKGSLLTGGNPRLTVSPVAEPWHAWLMQQSAHMRCLQFPIVEELLPELLQFSSSVNRPCPGREPPH